MIESIEFLKLDSRQVEQHFAQLPSFIDEDGEVLFDSLDCTNKPSRVSICKVRHINNTAWFMVSFEPESLEACSFWLLEPNSITSWSSIFNLIQQTEQIDRNYRLVDFNLPKLIEHIKNSMCSI